MDKRPIGIFDSGIGGLTVAKEIFKHLPYEDVVYFGDTARVPYGSKSPETVRKFSANNVNFLITQKVKVVIIACNTASATSIAFLRKNYPNTPIIGVIKPAVELAMICSAKKKIGVIATESTILSLAYQKEIKNLVPSVSVYGQPCPLFVPLVEEGWLDKEETYMIAQKYLKPLKSKDIDTLILGCTHYPLLKTIIKKVMGKNVAIIDSAGVIAQECEKVLKEKALSNSKTRVGWHKFFVSDNPERFKKVGEKFLNTKIEKVEKIEIEKF